MGRDFCFLSFIQLGKQTSPHCGTAQKEIRRPGGTSSGYHAEKVKQCLAEEGPLHASTRGTGCSPSLAVPHSAKVCEAGTQEPPAQQRPQGHFCRCQRCPAGKLLKWTPRCRTLQPSPLLPADPLLAAGAHSAVLSLPTALQHSFRDCWALESHHRWLCREVQQGLFSHVSPCRSLTPGHGCHTAMSLPCSTGTTVMFENVPWEPAVGTTWYQSALGWCLKGQVLASQSNGCRRTVKPK